jgi:hypothetical protein
MVQPGGSHVPQLVDAALIEMSLAHICIIFIREGLYPQVLEAHRGRVLEISQLAPRFVHRMDR